MRLCGSSFTRTHKHTNTHSCVHCRSIYAYGMYINTYIVFCCCCCCETSRVSSSSLSVLATLPPHLHPLSPVCSLSCCQPSSPTAYGEEKLLPGIFYVFRLLIFAILTCWVFLFPFLYFPFLCSALLCLALRRVHIFSLCLLPEL